MALQTISVSIPWASNDPHYPGYWGSVYDYWTKVFLGSYMSNSYAALIDQIAALYPNSALEVAPDPLKLDLPQVEIKLPNTYQTVVLSPSKAGPSPVGPITAVIAAVQYVSGVNIWTLYKGVAKDGQNTFLADFYGVTADDCAGQIRKRYGPGVGITYA